MLVTASEWTKHLMNRQPRLLWAKSFGHSGIPVFLLDTYATCLALSLVRLVAACYRMLQFEILSFQKSF